MPHEFRAEPRFRPRLPHVRRGALRLFLRGPRLCAPLPQSYPAPARLCAPLRRLRRLAPRAALPRPRRVALCAAFSPSAKMWLSQKNTPAANVLYFAASVPAAASSLAVHRYIIAHPVRLAEIAVSRSLSYNLDNDIHESEGYIMENNILQTLISDGVFSVAVAAYLLVRMEQKLADLTRAITELKTVIMQETRHNDAA